MEGASSDAPADGRGDSHEGLQWQQTACPPTETLIISVSLPVAQAWHPQSSGWSGQARLGIPGQFAGPKSESGCSEILEYRMALLRKPPKEVFCEDGRIRGEAQMPGRLWAHAVGGPHSPGLGVLVLGVSSRGQCRHA